MDIEKSGNSSLRPFQFGIHEPGNPDILLLHATLLHWILQYMGTSGQQSMSTDTIKQLASITDAAQFERIATSVLRSAKPSLYANISHQGVNTDGKTVKAPLDNVGWVRIDGESMLVAAAHTTASRDDLNGKWLHDPKTVTPRKSNGKPTQPAGDLVKAIGELAKFRVANSGLKATLALTCNREEPTDVRVKAEALAEAAEVSLDIWSVSLNRPSFPRHLKSLTLGPTRSCHLSFFVLTTALADGSAGVLTRSAAGRPKRPVSGP